MKTKYTFTEKIIRFSNGYLDNLTLGALAITTDKRKFIYLNPKSIAQMAKNPPDKTYTFESLKEKFIGQFTHEEMIIIQTLNHEFMHNILLENYSKITCKQYDNIYRKLRREGYMA